MDPNDTEAATNSSYEVPKFSCGELYATYVTVNDTIALWIIIGVISLASPTIVLLNALVIIALRVRKELQRLSCFLLFSVAISDLLIGAVCMPLSAIVDSFVARQTLSENVCVLEFLTVHLMYIISWSSGLHLTFIAWERYVAIQKWREYKSIVTKSRLNKFSIIAWVSATFMVLPDIILLTVVNADDRLNLAAAWSIVAAMLAVCALAVIVYFYVMVYLGIRKRKQSEISQVTSLKSAKLEKKVAKMTASVTAVLIISFLPVIVVAVLGGAFPGLSKRTAYRLAEILMQFNSIANPLIYCYGDRRFKNAVLELLRFRIPGTNQPGAVAGVRFVSRKGRFGSVENIMELQEKVNLMHFKRRASCDQAVALDFFQLKLRNELQGSNRPVSAPSLAELSSAAAKNVSQPAHSRIVECTAMIHSDRKERKQASKRNPGKLHEAVKMVAVWKEEQRVPLTDSWEDIDLLKNEREKRNIHLKVELQREVNLMHFKRRASFDQAVGLDCFQLRSCKAGFKRSISAPSLAKRPLAGAGNVSQRAGSRIVECTATIHSEREGRKTASKTNPGGDTRRAVERVSVGKEKRKVVVTDSREDIEVLQNEREKEKIHLKRSASCD